MPLSPTARTHVPEGIKVCKVVSFIFNTYVGADFNFVLKQVADLPSLHIGLLESLIGYGCLIPSFM
jgi:hypothetical protein